MSRKKKDYNIMVKQPKIKTIYGCSNPNVKDGTMMCDGDCSRCNFLTIEGTYKVY